MLTDAQIERYSRQILLAEVGARGQRRLLDARVAITGSGSTAAAVGLLLGRAGVGTLDLGADVPALRELSPDCRVERGMAPAPDVRVDLTGAHRPTDELAPVVLGGLDGREAVVHALVGRPCPACLEGARPAVPDGLAAAEAAALGALVASETLRLLLVPPARGRTTILALDGGTLAACELPATRGCAACGGRR